MNENIFPSNFYTYTKKDISNNKISKDISSNKISKDISTNKISKDISSNKILKDISTNKILKDINSSIDAFLKLQSHKAFKIVIEEEKNKPYFQAAKYDSIIYHDSTVIVDEANAKVINLFEFFI